MNKDITEEELIRLVKAHTKEGFDKLYDNYSSVLYSFICRSVADSTTAEDILQEVFIKIWKNIDKYDPGKGKLYTWMLRIARNTYIDHIRSTDHKHQQSVKTNEEGIMHMAEAKPSEIDFGLKALVAKLEPKHMDVIETIFYGHCTYAEAAKELGIPLGTLKTRARTALLLLRSSLQLNA